MLAPLLKTSATHTQPGLPSGSNQALDRNRDGQDFSRVFNQHNEPPVQERADKPVNKDVKNSAAKGESSTTDTVSSSAQADQAFKDASEQEIKNGLNKNADELLPVLEEGESELIIDAHGLEQTDSWSFWLQFVQDTATDIDKPLETIVTQQQDMPALVDMADTQAVLSAPSVTLPVEASKAVVLQQAGIGERSLVHNTETSIPLNTPFAGLNKYNLTEGDTLSDAVNELTSAADLPEAVNFTALAAASLPSTLAKAHTDMTGSVGEMRLVGEVAVDAARLEPTLPAGGQDNKWLSQTEQSTNTAVTTALEHKSFLQLRFNQQTLAPDLLEKTGWLIEHKVDTAQIQLDPPELGPIAVKIHTHQDQVSVSFVVANPQLRDALDQTLQRLKELLQEQGINLSHADVSDQRQQREHSGEEASPVAGGGELMDDELVAINLPHNESAVDHFV